MVSEHRPSWRPSQADKHIWHMISELCESPEWSLARGSPRIHSKPVRCVSFATTSSQNGEAGSQDNEHSGNWWIQWREILQRTRVEMGSHDKGSGKSNVKWISEVWRGSKKKEIMNAQANCGECTNKECRSALVCGYPTADANSMQWSESGHGT